MRTTKQSVTYTKLANDYYLVKRDGKTIGELIQDEIGTRLPWRFFSYKGGVTGFNSLKSAKVSIEGNKNA